MSVNLNKETNNHAENGTNLSQVGAATISRMTVSRTKLRVLTMYRRHSTE
jgi:hypothetical protein